MSVDLLGHPETWETSDVTERFSSHDQVEKLLESVDLLTNSVQQMSVSWMAERSDLVKELREIRQRLVSLEGLNEKVGNIEHFIGGSGKEHHIGERLHGLDLKVEYLAREVEKLDGVEEQSRHDQNQISELKSFQNRLMWGLIAACVTAVGALAWNLIETVTHLQKSH
jgi:DNA repair ATPase RecN